MRVLVLNGPNLNLLGKREPEVYGEETLRDLEERTSSWGEELGVEVEHFNSNHEGALMEAIHGSNHDGIVFNPGAFTHTSRALADAVSSVEVPVVEVHISNVKEREAWRRQSVLDGVAALSIYGRGLGGYRDALRHLVNRRAFDFVRIPYGPDPQQVGDLRRGGSGLVVLVHGGFWRNEWGSDTMESLAVDLSRRGFNTWNIEYRRIGSRGGWPGSAHDVLMGIEFTSHLGLEDEAVVLIGHSAGAHLAIWAGGRSAIGIRQIIALAPVTDLSRHASSNLFGAKEAQLLLDSGAPPHVTPGGVPTLLIHGEDDQLVPYEQSTGLADQQEIELLSPEGGHFDLLDPSKGHWTRVIDEL